VIHSEMPEQEDGAMEGFQLWLNLPARDKMAKPWYRDIPSRGIPEFVTAEGVTVRVIAGESHGVAGAISRPTTEPIYLDLHLPAGATFAQALPPGHHAFVLTYRGEVTVAGKAVGEKRMAILANSDETDGVVISTTQPARALLIAGKPLNEPIAQHGPFVMNTQEEIVQAFRDYQAGRFSAA